jgi:Fe2+ or Zn2+ uptake regulation protein
LGNLFAAIGITELSNKMASHTTDQELFVIKTFYSSGGSCVAVERQYHREFSVRVVPSRDTIYRTIKQFEETGSVCDKRARDEEAAHLLVRKNLSMQHWRQ